MIVVYWYRESDNTADEYPFETLTEAREFAKQKIDEGCTTVEVLTRGIVKAPKIAGVG